LVRKPLCKPVDFESADVGYRHVSRPMSQRNPSESKNRFERTSSGKFLPNGREPNQNAWQRFSLATDVIAFIRLNHLTADQTASLKGR
jgi:hypothetical protein